MSTDLQLKGNSGFSDYYLSNNLDEPLVFLPNFNKINILVGANNSGKSRFLRGLMNVSEYSLVENFGEFVKDLHSLNDLIEAYEFHFKMHADVYRILKQNFKSRLNRIKLKHGDKLVLQKVNLDSIEKNLITQIESNLSTVKTIEIIYDYYSGNSGDLLTEYFTLGYSNFDLAKFKSEDSLSVLKKILKILEKLRKQTGLLEGKKIYIPTLRTAHVLFSRDEKQNSKLYHKINNDVFYDTVSKNYSDLNSDIDIFTGLSLYDEIIDVRNSIREERIEFHAFEMFLSNNFFNGEDVDVVAKFSTKDKDIEDANIIQVYIGGQSRALHDLGDGVQAVIILMYKIFLAEDDSFIFIDEPELNLHPGYQRLFLEQITTNEELTKKNLRYVIVTHSNHLLDLTLEKANISIYSFAPLKQEENKFLIRNTNLGDNAILRTLGVNNSSVFLANCSVWVEGISDRNFIKAFLISYCKFNNLKEPLEDIDYAFFEYAGSNLIHYAFDKGNIINQNETSLISAYALSNNICLVSDLDQGKDEKHKYFEDLSKSNKNFNYYTTTPYREIENLIGADVWKNILIDFCDKTKLQDRQKVQNQIDLEIDEKNLETYKSEYIGVFLKQLDVPELRKIWNEDKKGEPKTFIYKTELSQILLDKVRTGTLKWDSFKDNSVIKDLTENIYYFIINHNMG